MKRQYRRGNDDVFFSLRLPADIAGQLARAAKIEAMGEPANLSATARRAIREYLKRYEGVQHDTVQ